MSLSFRDQGTNCVPEKRLRTRAWSSHEATARTREERQICVFTIANKRDPNGKVWNSNVLAGLRNNFRCLIRRESNLVFPEGDCIMSHIYARMYRCFIHGRRLFAINHSSNDIRCLAVANKWLKTRSHMRASNYSN